MVTRRIILQAGMFAFLVLSAGRVHAQYPVIAALDPSDPVYARQQEIVRDYYRRSSAGEPLPPLSVYRYTTQADDTLFGIAGRISVPYSAVATLNRLQGNDIGEPGREIYLPSIPGVFVPLNPENDLELVMADLRSGDPARVVTIGEESPVAFRFYPGADFNPEERSTFLGLLFRPPLQVMSVSSPFGPRANPVTGEWGFHAGVDLVAPRGTPVMAARSGHVAEIGTDPTLGNYIVLDHSGGFTTFYGHLDTILVSLMDPVRSGMIIGTVGNTGITTGSHLHFEIRQEHHPRDPLKLLP